MLKTHEKFDVSLPPRKPAAWTRPIVRAMQGYYTGFYGGKITKINMKGLKPPYIILSTHASMVDFALLAKAISPHLPNWVVSIEEFIGKEWLLRSVGGIYKRKFTSDIMVVKHMLTALKRGTVVAMYPEARFSLIGINEEIDGAIGKLVKVAKCPVVFMQMQGNFLFSPQWNKHPYRKIRVNAQLEQIITKEDAVNLPAEQLQARIEKCFKYDEYAWQYENKVKIDSEYRANNIHRVLYKCPHCKKDYTTVGEKTEIRCTACGKTYKMDEYGRLKALDGETEFESPSDWYRWERKTVDEEVNGGGYSFKDNARVEVINSTAEGFVPIGNLELTHDENGFTLKGKLDDGTDFYLNRAPETMRSLHIEYDYKNKGSAIELCTLKDTYFVYPLTYTNSLTRLHFATEALNKKQRAEKD